MEEIATAALEKKIVTAIVTEEVRRIGGRNAKRHVGSEK